MAPTKLSLHYDPISSEKNPVNAFLFKLLNATESQTDSVNVQVLNILNELVNYKEGELVFNPAIEAIIRLILVSNLALGNEDRNIFKYNRVFTGQEVTADITVDLTDPNVFFMQTSIQTARDGKYDFSLNVKGNDVEFEYELIN